jgi:hypothetical protein
VVEFDRRAWVSSLANYRVMGWDRCKLYWCTGHEAAARVRVCPTVKPEGLRGRTRVWYSKARYGVCIPLPIHAGRSLLWHPMIRSRTLDGGWALKVIHRLGRGVWH